MKRFLKLILFDLLETVYFAIGGGLLAVIFLGGPVVWDWWFPGHNTIGFLVVLAITGVTLWGLLALRQRMDM